MAGFDTIDLAIKSFKQVKHLARNPIALDTYQIKVTNVLGAAKECFLPLAVEDADTIRTNKISQRTRCGRSLSTSNLPTIETVPYPLQESSTVVRLKNDATKL